MSALAARKYRRVDIESAPKSSILDRLFERCVRDIDEATEAIAADDITGRAVAIDHAFRIISELHTALDDRKAPELAANLSGLYNFVLELLSAANTSADPEALAHARSIVEHIGESFRLAGEQGR